jgi:hypothetical protein
MYQFRPAMKRVECAGAALVPLAFLGGALVTVTAGWMRVFAVSAALVLAVAAGFRAKAMGIWLDDGELIVRNLLRTWRLDAASLIDVRNARPWWFIPIRLSFVDMTALVVKNRRRWIFVAVSIGHAPTEPKIAPLLACALGVDQSLLSSDSPEPLRHSGKRQ